MSFLIFLASFIMLFSLQIAYADNDPSFPFDKECLKYDKANFKEGGALLDLMTTGDFPQYCVLYSLSKYQIKQKMDDGYFIVGSNLDQQHAEASVVFIKSKSKTLGQWAYFIGPEEITQENGAQKEVYTFQEINL